MPLQSAYEQITLLTKYCTSISYLPPVHTLTTNMPAITFAQRKRKPCLWVLKLKIHPVICLRHANFVQHACLTIMHAKIYQCPPSFPIASSDPRLPGDCLSPIRLVPCLHTCASSHIPDDPLIFYYQSSRSEYLFQGF